MEATRMVLMSLWQGGNRDIKVENGLVDPAGGRRVWVELRE